MKATNNLICHITASVCLTIHTTLLSATCEGLNYDLGGLDTEERGLKTEVGAKPPHTSPSL